MREIQSYFWSPGIGSVGGVVGMHCFTLSFLGTRCHVLALRYQFAFLHQVLIPGPGGHSWTSGVESPLGDYGATEDSDLHVAVDSRSAPVWGGGPQAQWPWDWPLPAVWDSRRLQSHLLCLLDRAIPLELFVRGGGRGFESRWCSFCCFCS